MEKLRSGHWIVALAKLMPQAVIDFAFKRRYSRAINWTRPALERWLGDATTGREVVRGPIQGYRLAFDPVDSKAIWMGIHEPEVQKAVLSELQPGQVAFDIGAHIGYFVVLMATIVGKEGCVVGFEPDPGTFEFLQGTITLNSMDDYVQALNVALGSHAGMGLIERGYQSGYSKVIADGVGSVVVSTLDEQIYDQGLQRPDLILMDTEGAEEAILRGASRLLTEGSPTVIAEHHSNKDALIDLMKEHSYTYEDVDESHVLFRKVI